VGENTNRLEQEIRERQAGLGRNLDELQDKARDLADWRTHYRGHTSTFLGVAFGVGLLLGLTAVAPARRSKCVVIPERDASHDPDYFEPPRRVRWTQGQGTVARAARQFGDTWDQITDGLVRTASAKALQVVAELVPGFSDQFESPGPQYGRRTH
jgi:hypothetical protein